MGLVICLQKVCFTTGKKKTCSLTAHGLINRICRESFSVLTLRPQNVQPIWGFVLRSKGNKTLNAAVGMQKLLISTEEFD
jgi:hypothetical protein